MAELNKQFPTHAPIVTLAMHPVTSLRVAPGRGGGLRP